MPLDASIYNLVKPQKFASPMETMGGAMQLRALVDQQGLQAMQRRQLERGMADDDATRAAYAQSGGDPVKVRELLYGQGLYKPAMAIDKQILDSQKSKAEIAAKKMETLSKGAAVLKGQLPTVRDEQSYQRYREAALQIFGPTEVGKMNLPQSFDPQWVRNQLVEAQQLFTPRPERVDQGGKIVTVDMNPFTNPSIVGMQFTKTQTPDNIATNATTRRGQDLTDRRAREAAEAGRWVNDLERGIQINTTTGESRPIMSGGRPVEPKKDVVADKQRTVEMYVAARDGLLSGLEGSETGPITGRVPAYTAAQQTAEGGVAAMAPVLKQLFRAAGEGVFTDRDQQLLLDMVPKRTDLPQARKDKMANIDRIVAAKLGLPIPERAVKPEGEWSVVK